MKMEIKKKENINKNWNSYLSGSTITQQSAQQLVNEHQWTKTLLARGVSESNLKSSLSFIRPVKLWEVIRRRRGNPSHPPQNL